MKSLGVAWRCFIRIFCCTKDNLVIDINVINENEHDLQRASEGRARPEVE